MKSSAHDTNRGCGVGVWLQGCNHKSKLLLYISGAGSRLLLGSGILASTREKRPSLHLVTAEEIVLFAAGAVSALQAADQKDRHAQGDNHSDGVSVGHEPVN